MARPQPQNDVTLTPRGHFGGFLASLTVPPGGGDLLYVGTELGIYCSMDRGKTCHSLTHGLPTVAVHDIAVHPRDGDLVIGTHGRSAFVLDAKRIRERAQAAALRRLIEGSSSR